MAAPHKAVGPKSEKPWRHAIQKAVKEWIKVDENGKSQKRRALNLLAQKIVRKGIDGDVAALKEIGDRLDGKPVQGVELGLEVKITRIERQIVEPQAVAGPVIEGVAVVVSEIDDDQPAAEQSNNVTAPEAQHVVVRRPEPRE